MAAISVQRKPDPLQAWEITDVPSLLVALTDMIGLGYLGAPITDGTGQIKRLEIKMRDQDPIQVAFGEWLVLDITPRRLTAEEFAANYDLAEA